ncbi:hypothetical protein BH11PSE12_BH11PSE12_17310 [soil metagenome]
MVREPESKYASKPLQILGFVRFYSIRTIKNTNKKKSHWIVIFLQH